MLGQHPIRRLAAVSLLASVLFAAYVANLWYDADRSWWEWSWEDQDSTIIGRALGEPVASPDSSLEFSAYLRAYPAKFEGRLIQLLRHADPAVGQAAARQLSAGPTLAPEFLPALIAAHQRGLQVLPSIAKVGTTEAVEYVAATSRSNGNWTELAAHLFSAGPAGRQRLAAIYREPHPVPSGLHRKLCEIVYSPSPSRPKDCGVWLEVARDPQSPETNRLAALELLALMGDDPTGNLSALKELAATGPSKVAAAGRGVAAQLEGKGTLAQLKPRLEFELSWRDRPDLAVETVEQIGKLGAAGRNAGPLITPLLSSPNWYLRATAATALGRIGYTEATPALITALEDRGDWIVSGAAAEALARLGAKEAVPALQRVASSHWYPPVRAMAAESVQVLSGQATFADFQRPPPYFGWYGEIALDRHVLEFSQTPPTASAALRFTRRLSCLIGNTWDRACLWRARRVAKSANTRYGWPAYGQAFGDGYLLGYDNGEWGGGVAYVVDGKVVREFPTGNVFGFYPMPFGLVVVTSYSYTNVGMVFLLKQDASAMPTCEPLQRLPFEPDRFPHIAPVARRWNRELLILGDGNQAVVLTRSGELRMAD